MKPKVVPSPTPIPIDWIYKAFPILTGIPQNIIWGVVGSIATVLLHYLYGLVNARRIMTVEIAMKNSLHENQLRIERIHAANRERWDQEISDQRVEMTKLANSMERVSEQMEGVVRAIDLHGKTIHKIEIRINSIEGKR